MIDVRPYLLTGALLLVACGDDDGAAPATTATSVPETTEVTTTSAAATTTAAPTTVPPTTAPATTVAPTTTAAPTTSAPLVLEQLAVWPAADVAYATPEEAAASFVSEVLRVPPVLGEFRPGDLRSGEMEVFLEAEDGRPLTTAARALLMLRQLGPSSGWFVLGAASEHVSIESPAAGATVPAGPLLVSGAGRGFEATLVVSAFVAGDPRPLDTVVAQGGAFATAEPYTAEVDLSGAPAGGAVAVLVRGGTGLETDPGDFAVLPVRIAPP